MTRLEIARRDRRVFRTDIVRESARLFGKGNGVGESTIYEAEKIGKSPNVKTMRKIQAAINELTKGKFPPISLEDICEEETPAKTFQMT